MLENANGRWELSERGVFLRDDVDEEDDDSTSDFEPSKWNAEMTRSLAVMRKVMTWNLISLFTL